MVGVRGLVGLWEDNAIGSFDRGGVNAELDEQGEEGWDEQWFGGMYLWHELEPLDKGGDEVPWWEGVGT